MIAFWWDNRLDVALRFPLVGLWRIQLDLFFYCTLLFSCARYVQVTVASPSLWAAMVFGVKDSLDGTLCLSLIVYAKMAHALTHFDFVCCFTVYVKI